MPMFRPLGKYEIIDEIGRGGFATVYRARDPHLDRQVALKVLDPLLLGHPDLIERFRREARAAASLRHPHIVRIYEIVEADGRLALVLELLPGPSLAGVIESEAPMPLASAIALLRPLADALDYAHSRGLVHRDIKPSNAILDEKGQPVLTDFGLVKAVEESGSSAISLTLSQSGLTLGTPAYMAPEQADPKRSNPVDFRADLYSLGVMAYQMLTGQVPFQGDTPLVVAIGHLMEEPPPPAALNPDLPQAAADVLLRMLAKKPDARYPSATAFVDALDTAETASVELQEPPPAPEAKIEKPQKAVLVEPEQASPRPRVPDWAWLLAVPAVLLLAAGLGWFLGSRDVSPTPTPMPSPTEVAVLPTATALALTETPTPEPTPVDPSRGDTWTRPADGMEMVFLPAGEFSMGSDEGEIDEKPMHDVYLDAYWIDKTEVTNAQYRKCVEGGACSTPQCWGDDLFNDPYQPVVCVNWFQAEAYCQWVGARLPTEAEWEKAARGTQGRIYPWGNAFDGTKLNYCDANCEIGNKDTGFDDGYARTAPVGSYPAGGSPCGALDMAGNVWEWVADRYASDYYRYSPERNPQGPSTGGYRVLRGGSWNSDSDGARSTSRIKNFPVYAYISLGFRCGVSSTFSP
jgi:serine/threonine-protein kinase